MKKKRLIHLLYVCMRSACRKVISHFVSNCVKVTGACNVTFPYTPFKSAHPLAKRLHPSYPCSRRNILSRTKHNLIPSTILHPALKLTTSRICPSMNRTDHFWRKREDGKQGRQAWTTDERTMQKANAHHHHHHHSHAFHKRCLLCGYQILHIMLKLACEYCLWAPLHTRV